MKILALKEKGNNEKRVSITPDLISKYNKLGYEVFIEAAAGENCSISDKIFENSGAKIIKDISAEIGNFDIILTVQSPEKEDLIKLSKVKKGVILLGGLNPYLETENTKLYSKNNISAIAAELFPRITRAQSIDILSSQSNLAGYRAVIDAVYELETATPMMMTAAGTISPAKIMIIGAGVAGLQAIATAKRLGAVVSAFDVRVAAREQVQSLGGKFIEVKGDDDGQTKGGYAKEMSEEYKKKQEKVIFDNIIKQDIVISTALIPGKPAPKIITSEMVKSMKAGAVIIDMAAIMGGNCSETKLDKVTVKNGVKIIGYGNIPSRVARDASKLYSKNLYNFIDLITNKENQSINLDLEDEIIKSSLISHQGQVLFG
jgi:H+-translocating NAD(P) transhydrogenase subunit alpha